MTILRIYCLYPMIGDDGTERKISILCTLKISGGRVRQDGIGTTSRRTTSPQSILVGEGVLSVSKSQGLPSILYFRDALKMGLRCGLYIYDEKVLLELVWATTQA